MNPVSTHTIRRFVWMAFTTSNGRRLSSGSGPRYFTAASSPKTICRPNSSMATTKYGYAIHCVRYRIRVILLSQGHQVCHELLDLLGRQYLHVVVRHERPSIRGVDRPRDQMRVRIHYGLADVPLGIGGRAPVVRAVYECSGA